MNIFEDVREFARVAQSANINNQGLLSTLLLCKNLIAEESQETLDALAKYKGSPSLENLTEAVDGAIDTIYVCAFFLNQMGLNSEAHWKLVQERNMAKFPDGKVLKNEYGKVVKPAGWYPPDHLPLLIEWNSQRQGATYVGGMMKHGQSSHDQQSSTSVETPERN